MKVGDYVRTNYGIKQIYEIDNNKTVWKYKFKLKKQDGNGCIDLGCFSDSDIIKSSPNIIDLIEVGDYVNGKLVIDTYTDYIFDYSEEFKVIRFSETDILHNEKHIKSIVTKEQFERMEYKI